MSSDLERKALDATADATVIIDESGCVCFFNRQAVEIFGYASDEVIGRNVSLLMPEPDSVRHDSYLQQYRDTGKSRIIGRGRDVVGRTKAGQAIPLWLRVGELRTEDGKRYFVGSLRDIAERNRLEEALRGSEARYRYAHQLARIGHWVWRPGPDGDPQGGISEYSAEAAEIFGVTPGTLAISNKEYVSLFVHPEDRDMVVKLIAGVQDWPDRRYSARYRILRPDGEVRVVREIGECIFDGLRYSDTQIGIIQDISDQAVTEERLRTAEMQHERGQLIARLGHWIQDFGPNGEWWTDIPQYSQSVAKILGMTPEELAIPNGDFLNRFVIPEDRESLMKCYGQFDDPSVDRYSTEYRIRRPDGEILTIREIGEIQRDAEGRARSLTGTFQDVSEQKKLEHKLEQEVLRAEMADRAKSQFLATMSHELRTPLNAIIGFSSLIENETFGPIQNARYREYIRDINASGEHLLSLINDILALSRIEAGKHDFDFQPVDPAAALTHASSLISSLAFEKEIRMIGPEGGTAGNVLGDRRAINQILMNIIGNAIKFTDRGGEVALLVEPRSGAGMIALVVADNGQGIPADSLASLGQPFVQVAPAHTRSQGGSGLGLAISKLLARGMKGHIEIDSELGRGTVVRLLLPRADV
ncbi:MAG: PAS domain S-box protein [Rhodospirillaceae bacterium]|nr:PAS domain S-box protein [Rhodospirillaceae bacterium]